MEALKGFCGPNTNSVILGAGPKLEAIGNRLKHQHTLGVALECVHASHLAFFVRRPRLDAGSGWRMVAGRRIRIPCPDGGVITSAEHPRCTRAVGAHRQCPDTIAMAVVQPGVLHGGGVPLVDLPIGTSGVDAATTVNHGVDGTVMLNEALEELSVLAVDLDEPIAMRHPNFAIDAADGVDKSVVLAL